ncbi:amino acid ABC transporter substrate-binding protein [Paraburkholderia aspalathi]|uniref:Amino acid ABC transporter substrate-binding protein, PAAT family n=1 Tax=Paraburkholderia aspalathi TaxID=1324617 RepID=A0A1I7ELU7_9BURK|nr:amino acid ABC transporter substrate-binding protein [Paraburkholderia aspalathi]SFU24906.1 amino acid ABC transporter substrate-binding protein, PAAT family [Paraburkholderia aspalathi]
MKPSSLFSATFIIAGSVIFGCAHAEAPSRLDKIKESQTISLGYPSASLPFAYLDNQQKPTGYSVEICQHIVQHIKASLNLPTFNIRYVPVTSATRIPLLRNGTIDLECGNTTNTAERQKLVSSAPATFVAKTVLTARKDAGVDVNNPASFSGKSITSMAGGLALSVVQQISAEKKLNISALPSDNAASSFLLVKTGRAAAMSNDDGLTYALVATSGDPQDYVIGTKALLAAPYGIVEPKDDPRFKHEVDAAVLDLIKSKQIYALYDKWFTSPIPPSGINLKFPMSDVFASRSGASFRFW